MHTPDPADRTPSDILLPADPAHANRLLCDAAESGDSRRVGALLQIGANPRGHFDPEAARRDHIRFAEHMERHLQSHPELTPIAEDPVAEQADLKRVMSAPDGDDIPLFQAARSGNAECVRLLLAAGADPLVRDSYNESAIFHAESVHVIRLLIAAGVPLEAVGDKESPLARAVMGGRDSLEKIAALIEAGADVNAVSRGRTVFMHAVSIGGNVRVLRMLLDAGANPHATDDTGWNAFHQAIDPPFGRAFAGETFAFLKSLGVNIDQRDIIGQTPLAFAIERGSAEEAVALCQLGADPNAICGGTFPGPDGYSHAILPLLFFAVAASRPGIITAALLKAGANPLVTDSHGLRPLHHAVARLIGRREDHETLYHAFFRGRHTISLPPGFNALEGEPRIATLTSCMSDYVEQFATTIPLHDPVPHQIDRRKDSILCIAALLTHEYARTVVRSQNP